MSKPEEKVATVGAGAPDVEQNQYYGNGAPSIESGEYTDNADSLQRRLGNRQIQLIAIGGSIGTALFVR